MNIDSDEILDCLFDLRKRVQNLECENKRRVAPLTAEESRRKKAELDRLHDLQKKPDFSAWPLPSAKNEVKEAYVDPGLDLAKCDLRATTDGKAYIRLFSNHPVVLDLKNAHLLRNRLDEVIGVLEMNKP